MRTGVIRGIVSVILTLSLLVPTLAASVPVIAQQPPPTPTSPRPGSTSSPGPTLGSKTVTLQWDASSGATRYALGVRNMNTNLLEVDTWVYGTSYTVTLQPNTPYRWNVAAWNTAGYSPFTARLYFQTPSDLSPPPTPTNPRPGSTSSPGPTLGSKTVTLQWDSSPGATRYALGVRNMNTNLLEVDTWVYGTSYTVTLQPNTPYRWNVAAWNTAGYSSFTAPRYFKTPPDPPPTPTNPRPGSTSSPGPTLGSKTVTLQWDSSPGATRYALGVRNMNTNLLEVDTWVYGTSYTVTLQPNTPYRWNVAAWNDAGYSPFTARLYFQTPGSPDLTVIGTVSFSPSSGMVGQSISVTFTVKNEGNSASGSFSNRISLATTQWGADYSLGNFAMSSLGAQASRTVTITTNVIPSSVPCPRSYYVTVFTDGFEQVSESYENNNIGSSTPSMISVSCLPDNPPTVSIGYPSNGDTFAISTITVSGTASDDKGVSKVEVKVGAGSWQLASGTTSWGKQVTLSPGSNTIYAKATDTSGNPSNQASVTVNYIPPDNPPTISIGYPPNGDTFTTPTITVSGTASDDKGVSKVEVKIGAGSWQLASGTTSWGKQVTLSPGSNTIYAKATDTSGNPSNQASVTVNYIPPDNPPTISIGYPPNGDTFTTPTITVSGTASDDKGVSKVEVKIGAGSWQLASGTTSWSKQVTLSPGSNTIYAKATDTSGNPSNQASVTVNYYIQPPDNPPTADFSADLYSGCAPLTVHFTDLSTAGDNPITSWYWDFGDGDTSTAQNPSHIYDLFGTYPISLTVTDSHEYSDTETKTVTVYGKPAATASSNSPVPQGATIQLYGGPDGMASYSWTGPGGWTSSLQNPTRTNAAPAMAGTYTLTVTNGHGCSDGDTTSVIVTVGGATPVKFSIPVYSPYYQIAPKGTELTYVINVKNEWDDENIIRLFVSEQSAGDWWDVKFLSSIGTLTSDLFVTLSPSDSEDIYLKVVIPKNQPGSINEIIVKGESLLNYSADEITIKAQDMEPDSVLFVIQYFFKTPDNGHSREFEIPNYAEMYELSKNQISVAFNPISMGDLDRTYLKIRDVVDGILMKSETLPVRFEQNSEQVITTDFDMKNDAYSFSNNIWPEGKCFGMAASSVFYFTGEESLPSGFDSTYSLTDVDAQPTIDKYQNSTEYNSIRNWWYKGTQDNKMSTKEYEKLRENIEKGEPMLFFMSKESGNGKVSHVVLAYRIVEDISRSYILIYDNNWPLEFNLGYYSGYPYIVYNRATGDLWYEDYSIFKPTTAAPWWRAIKLWSPAELRVYDSKGRVTGLVNGEVKNEIPSSNYDEERKTVKILFPLDSYVYEVVALEEGAYGLEVTNVEGGESSAFTAIDITTTSETVHQYTVDWDALSEGEEGITVHVDSDGDGEFEDTFTCDEELTNDEFMSQLQGCFIVTAAYGTPMAEEIQILRGFRDKYLLTNPVGQALVDLYYKVSPPIAEFITEHPSLKPIVRVGLMPAVAMSTVAVNTTLAEKMAMVGLLVLVSVAVAIYVTTRRDRGQEYT